MGVNTFLLDRRTAMLQVGPSIHTVGTLRRFFKLTELDDVRAAELNEAARVSQSPVAVLNPEITEWPTAGEPNVPVAAHLVLGWDEGRSYVTDFGWDYLPQLGYAVRDHVSGHYNLYEEVGGILHTIDGSRASELGLLDDDGKLVRRGQPLIALCRSVRPSIAGYVEADCVFDDGRQEKLLVSVTGDTLPEPAWFKGKKPRQVERYTAHLRSDSKTPTSLT